MSFIKENSILYKKMYMFKSIKCSVYSYRYIFFVCFFFQYKTCVPNKLRAPYPPLLDYWSQKTWLFLFISFTYLLDYYLTLYIVFWYFISRYIPWLMTFQRLECQVYKYSMKRISQKMLYENLKIYIIIIKYSNMLFK